MNHSRLIDLRNLLSNLPDHHRFDMEVWECDTSACAMGFACLHPPFNDEGLKLSDPAADCVPVPLFMGNVGHDAAKEFFGLSDFESKYLFSPLLYAGRPQDITPEQVVERINQMLLYSC